MTDDQRDKDLLADIARIGSSLPEIPNSFGELRALIARLPSPTPPDVKSARAGTADSLVVSSFGSSGAQSPLSGPPIGQDSGSGIGILPQLFYGKSNALDDPMMRNVGTQAFTAALTTLGNWRCMYVLNSGGLPATKNLNGRSDTVFDSFSVLNSDVTGVATSGYVAGDVTYLVQSRYSYPTPPAAPYMLASVRLALINGFSVAFTNITSATVQIEAIDGVSSAVLASSTPFDFKAWALANQEGSEVRLTAPYLNNGVHPDLRWQLRYRVVSTGAGASIELLFGEPQLAASSTELPPPFSPVVGPWNANRLETFGFTASDLVASGEVIGDNGHRYRVNLMGDTEWGSGVFTRDLRIYRASAAVLGFDAVAGGRASIEGRGGTTPGAAAALFGRLYYQTASKSWHQVDDAGLDTDLAFGSATRASNDSAVAAAADYVARIKLAADTTYRAFLGLNAADQGSLEWGGGGVAARDLRLFRNAGQLTLDTNGAAAVTRLAMWSTAGQTNALTLGVTGDTVVRTVLWGDATTTGLELGPGGAGARDLRAIRSAAGTLKIDSVGGAVSSALIVEATAGQLNQIAQQVAGDTNSRVIIRGDASQTSIALGPGSAAGDVRARRSAAKVLTIDDNAAGAATLNVIGAIQQGGVQVSLVGHGAADHADITRSFFLRAGDANLDGATLIAVGASPQLSAAINYADAATSGAYWAFTAPPDLAGASMSVQPMWSPGATDAVAHTVRWSMTSKVMATGSDVTAAGTTTPATGASAARTINIMVTDNVQTTVACAAGDRMRIEMQRIGADVADSYIGAVRLLGLYVTYTANQ